MATPDPRAPKPEQFNGVTDFLIKSEPRRAGKATRNNLERLHGPGYVRMVGAEGEEIGDLGVDCGHHCGVATTGRHQRIGHCHKACCHADE